VFEKRRGILVGCRVRKDPPDEAITERFGVSRKTLSRAEAVPLEAVGHHGQIIPLEALPDRVKLIGSCERSERNKTQITLARVSLLRKPSKL
jgi:hypothetical protein